ncbi:unnamed protein product, partial [Musa hybrid cultivar]
MCSRRTSWISVRYQTLFLGVACLLFILYKYFPSLFSLILYSYPLIICTTIFLGILSRYRKPDAPKKEDDRKTRRSSSLKIQSVENSLRAKKEESFKLKAHVGSRRTFKKMTIRTIVSGDTIHNAPSKGIEDNQVNQIDAATVASSSSVDRKSEKNITVLDVNADKTKLDHYVDSCLGSPWYHVDHQDASLGSEFDHQDPSVVNATPILGELDPHISKGISDDNSASFSQNHVIDEGTEAENQDDNGAQEEKDDGNKVGVTWSADDKRKLMDLGDSEVERNRRLENLIARRRARKAMEKNIIDLDNNMETSESHGQLPPISINAPRRNLFSLPYDLDESIPGSAPSILLPRRNPFDLPYEQVDEEEDWGRNEFVTIPQRDILFRRHESFTIGASFFLGGFEQDWYSSRFGDSEMSSTLESDSVSTVANQEHQKDLCRENSQSSVDVEKVKCQMNMNNDNETHSSAKHIHQATEDFGAESSHEHQKDSHLEGESFKTHKAEPGEQGSQFSDDIEQVECQMNMNDDRETHLMTKRIHQTTEDLGDVKGDISKKLISCSPISYAEREVADEKCESNSSILSEVERNSPKTSTHEQTVNIEQINSGSCRGLTVSTESIAIDSDVANVEAEKVHDSHVEESLSISSPTATRKSHSNSSVVDEKCKYDMAIKRNEIRVYIEKIMVFCVRTSYRCARDHPFVFALVFFLLVLYRSFPSLFAFLVSSSPVIVCMTVLLGLLLSYGEPNIPEIEIEDTRTREVSSVEIRSSVSHLCLKKDENLTVENHVEKRTYYNEIVPRETIPCEEKSSADVRIYQALEQYEGTERIDTIVGDSASGVQEKKDRYDEEVIQEEETLCQGVSENRDLFVGKTAIDVAEVSKDISSFDTMETQETEDLKLETGEPKLDHHLDSSLGLSWQSIDDHHSSSDTESDRAESSSPDASITDIIPMLDELHPLLDSEHPQHVSIPKSDAASEGSSLDDEPDDNSIDEEAEIHDEEEDDEAQEKDDGTEAAVKWTEDDQKNFMDLGSSELERNQRLESLIAKQKEKKNLSFVMDRNLIDLDVNASFPGMEKLSRFRVQVPPISAPRRNPFDVPYDSEETFDLPPMPGSAPSSLLPRRNPFDLFYDQREQNSSLTDETWGHQDFVSAPQHEMLVRRNETFSLRRKEFKQERGHSRLKPYFVAEKLDSEEGSSTFQRQYSDRNESKVSSIPESDTDFSVTDQEYNRELEEQVFDQETELLCPGKHDADAVEHESHTSEETESVDIEQEKTEHVTDDREIGVDTNLTAQENEKVSAAGEAFAALEEDFFLDADQGVNDDSSVTFDMQKEDSEVASFPRPFDGNAASGIGDLMTSEVKVQSSSDLSSDEIHPVVLEADEIDENLPTELDELGDFHTEELTNHQGSEMIFQTEGHSEDTSSGTASSFVDDYTRLQVSEGRSILHADRSVNQSSEANFDKCQGVSSLVNQPGVMELEIHSSFASIVEARSVEDIHSAFKQISEVSPQKPVFHEAESQNLQVTEHLDAKQRQSDMHVIEAKSIEDIGLAFSELSHNTSKKTQEISEESHHKPIHQEVGSPNFEGTEHLDAKKIQSDLHVVEAKSIDDIGLAFSELSHSTRKKAQEISEVNLHKSIYQEVGSQNFKGTEHLDAKHIQSDLHVIEAKSIEDIGLAFSELSHNTSKKAQEINEESLHKLIYQEVGSPNFRSSEHIDAKQIQSDLHVIEAKSIEDISLAFVELSHNTSNKAPTVMETVDGSVEVN